jgi:hypothetical protein
MERDFSRKQRENHPLNLGSPTAGLIQCIVHRALYGAYRVLSSTSHGEGLFSEVAGESSGRLRIAGLYSISSAESTVVFARVTSPSTYISPETGVPACDLSFFRAGSTPTPVFRSYVIVLRTESSNVTRPWWFVFDRGSGAPVSIAS